MVMKRFAIVTALSLLSSTAIAANHGFYIGADAGYIMPQYRSGNQTVTQFNGKPLNATVDDKNQDIAYGVNFGYLWANGPEPEGDDLSYGVEAGYTYYGQLHDQHYTSNGTSGDLDQSASMTDLMAVLDVNLTNPTYQPAVDVFLKGGVALFFLNQTGNGTVTDSSNNSVNFATEANGSKQQFAPIIQVGVGVDVLKNVNVNIFYQRTFARDYKHPVAGQVSSLVATIDEFGGGVTYYFGN